jgi:hypothetical protein
LDGQKASAVGRTWRITALWCWRTASSNHEISSACCCAALRPVLDGQSMFTTDATQLARNCRSGVAGLGAQLC